jgi:ribosomal-protein-alanine N-acetyltransferase
MFLNLYLETERLIIRPYVLTDVDALFTVVSEPNFYDFIPEDVPTKEDVRRIIEWSIHCNQKNTPSQIHKLNLAIIDKKSETLIGYCGLGPDDVKAVEIELYYGIAQAYRGKGMAFEAAYALMNYAFQIIGLAKIIAVVHPDNIASIRILDKLGMKFQYTYNNLAKSLEDFEGLLHYELDALKFSQ